MMLTFNKKKIYNANMYDGHTDEHPNEFKKIPYIIGCTDNVKIF